MSSTGAGAPAEHAHAGGAAGEDEVDYGDAGGAAYEGGGGGGEVEGDDGGAGAGGAGGEEDDLDDLDAIQAQLDAADEATTNVLTTAAAATKTADELQRERARQEEERVSRDERSIFVSGLDWNWVGQDLSDFFGTCGAVARATVLADKFGQPKG